MAGHHDFENFACGEPSLDDWLKRRARANQAAGASRCFVTAETARVVGYYALASGALATTEGTGRFRRNMPAPIPVVILGRLAVDLTMQRTGLGRALFRDCALRVNHAADAIGIRGIVVHALSEAARDFYLSLGFDPSPADPMLLMVTLADIRSLLV